jgi:glycolate oxidase FAD binding subunit
VTGYDLPKLHTGALGTLGVIVEATFKVAPLPETSRGLLLTMPTSANEQAAFLARLHNETAPTISLLREVPSVGRVLGLVYTGFEEVVNGELSRALNIAQTHGSEPTGLAPGIPPLFTTPPPPDAPLILRVGKNRADGLARHNALANRTPVQWTDTLPGTGHTDLYVQPGVNPADVLRQMVQWCKDERALLTVLHAPQELRGQPGEENERTPLWFPFPPHFPLLARTKAALDAGNVCNAGRFIGGL